MKAIYSLRPADVRTAATLWYKTWDPSTFHMSRSAGGLMLFLGAIGLVGCFRSLEESWGFCVMTFAFAFACFRFPSLRIQSHVRAFLAAAPEGKLEQTVTVTPNGLVFTGPSMRLECAWNYYRALTRHPEGLLLAGPGTVFHWIPAQARVEGGSWQEMERLLNDHVPPRKEDPK